MNKVKFAIIGAGYIGKKHATMIQVNEEAKLVAMADIKPELETVVKDSFKVPFYSSMDELLAGGHEIDVLCICTPNGLHAQQSIKALEAGCHVVCEKPMGLTRAECEDVIFKSLQAHKLIFCVMQNRYSPPSIWLKDLIDTGKLGKIHMVQVNCYWNRDERYYRKGNWKGSKELDGGTLFTQFSHFIDMMFWYFGDIKNVHSRMADFRHAELTEFEDSGIVSFDFVKGGMGVLNFSTAVWNKNMESSITIVAEKGSIKVGGQYMNEVEYCHVEDYEMPELAPSNPPNDYGGYKGSAANHHYVIENVVATIKGRTIATTNAMEGMKVVEIVEKMYGKS